MTQPAVHAEISFSATRQQRSRGIYAVAAQYVGFSVTQCSPPAETRVNSSSISRHQQAGRIAAKAAAAYDKRQHVARRAAAVLARQTSSVGHSKYHDGNYRSIAPMRRLPPADNQHSGYAVTSSASPKLVKPYHLPTRGRIKQ